MSRCTRRPAPATAWWIPAPGSAWVPIAVLIVVLVGVIVYAVVR